MRDNYDTTPAVLANSLFLDFMLKNGLEVWNDESTRSVICIDFKYGSRSYKEDLRHIEKLIEKNPDKADKYEELKKKIEANKDKYDKKSKSELREMFYENGIDVYYRTHNRQGRVIKEEVIHYKRLCRTAGKAKQGKCMFVDERLYDTARNFVTMGIELPEHNAPVVELEAYSALIMSGIVGRIQIDPDSILILNDFDSYMKTDVVAVKTNEKKQCVAERLHDYEIHNEMFDGQALIDSSIFPPWGDGYVLLRQHFFKAAAFCTHIQKFFRDFYKEAYDSAEIKDIFGTPHKVKDIKVITTTNACKFLKLNASYEHWKKYVNQLGNLFGVVKTSHPSKLGEFQRMSYQMTNTLDVHMMDEAMQTTVDYLTSLKEDDTAFLNYLKREQNFSNDYEVLLALVELDPDFIRSKYFKERRAAIISAYVKNIRGGRLLQNAENLTIVGSPYAMLMWTVGLNPEDDPTFENEDDAIQCYTARFDDGEYLAEYRSPMNSRNNVGCLHNHYHEYFTKYFNLGKQIVAVNMVHTSFQPRNNGLMYTGPVEWKHSSKDIR